MGSIGGGGRPSAGWSIGRIAKPVSRAVAALAVSALAACSSPSPEPSTNTQPSASESPVSSAEPAAPSATPTPTTDLKSEAAVEAAVRNYFDTYNRVINANDADDSPLLALGMSTCNCGLEKEAKDLVKAGASVEGFQYQIQNADVVLGKNKDRARVVADLRAKDFLYRAKEGAKPETRSGLSQQWVLAYVLRDGDWKVESFYTKNK